MNDISSSLMLQVVACGRVKTSGEFCITDACHLEVFAWLRFNMGHKIMIIAACISSSALICCWQLTRRLFVFKGHESTKTGPKNIFRIIAGMG